MPLISWFGINPNSSEWFLGIQIFLVTLPNFLWTMNANSSQIAEAQLKLCGSLKAVIGGYLLIVIYTSSLYHLLLISIQRFTAIKWPVLYRISGNRSTFRALFCVWLKSLIVGSIPGMQFCKLLWVQYLFGKKRGQKGKKLISFIFVIIYHHCKIISS